MAFKIAASPGITVREIDLTTVVQAAEATDGFIAGPFNWGPVGEVVTVNNEDTLLKRAGKPQSVKEATTFFSAAAFLAYTDKLRYVRIGGSDQMVMRNAISYSGTNPETGVVLPYTGAVVNGSAVVSFAVSDGSIGTPAITPSPDIATNIPVNTILNIGGSLYKVTALNTTATPVDDGTPAQAVTHTATLDRVFTGASNAAQSIYKTTLAITDIALIKNDDAYDLASSLPSCDFIAKYPGEFGNDLEVVVCASASQYSAILPGTFAITKGSKTATYTPATTETAADYFAEGDYFVVANVKYTVASVATNVVTLAKAFVGVSAPTATVSREWKYGKFFGKAPTTDHGHVIVIDKSGTFSGVEGTVLELYSNVAIAAALAAEKTDDGSANYWKTAINRKSQFIRAADGDLTTYVASLGVTTLLFALGLDGNDTWNTDEYIDAYSEVENSESVDVSLIIAPDIGSKTDNQIIANYITDNICEIRKDCVSFVSPNRDAVVDNVDNEVNDIIDFVDGLSHSSYVIVDSGWKQVYDKYNDTYRWIPLAADIAGLTARTEQDRAPWYSPAGFNRGILKNVVKLAWSPVESQRDDLYTNGVNSVVNFKGAGNILYGDKTLAVNQSSAFAHINVRRLFIVIEKAIANAAKYMLFEFNDEFTRAQFVAMVEPFLRDVKGGRGIQDFKVVCDETNNTGQVIDSNGFVGDIYIKPARSINFITLNFVAVRTDVSFEEVVGTI